LARHDALSYSKLLHLPSIEGASAEAVAKISAWVAKRYLSAKLYCRHGDIEFVRACGARSGLTRDQAYVRLWTRPGPLGSLGSVDALPSLPVVQIFGHTRPALRADEVHDTVVQGLVSHVRAGAPAAAAWSFDQNNHRLRYYKGLTLWRRGWDHTRNVVARATATVGWGIVGGQWSDIAVHVDESDGTPGVEMVKLLAVFSITSRDDALLPDIVGERDEHNNFSALYIFAIKYNKPASWPRGVAANKSVPRVVRQSLKPAFSVLPVGHIAGLPIVQPHFQATGEPPANALSRRALSASSALDTDGITYYTPDVDLFSRAPRCPCDVCKALAARPPPPPWHVTPTTGLMGVPGQ